MQRVDIRRRREARIEAADRQAMNPCDPARIVMSPVSGKIETRLLTSDASNEKDGS